MRSGSRTVLLDFADGLGSTMVLPGRLDSSGNSQKSYQYDVYGEVTGGSGGLANEFDFAGQQTDATGLQYLRARYYDPETGTFLSREPLAVSSSWRDAVHGYASGNPTRFFDSSGLIPVEGCEPSCGSAVQLGPGVEQEGLWMDLYTEDDGNLNIRACRFAYSGTEFISGMDCSEGFFPGGFSILVGEYCSLDIAQNGAGPDIFSLLCNGPNGLRAAAVSTTEPGNFDKYDTCIEGAAGAVILSKGAGGPPGWAVEAAGGCFFGLLVHEWWSAIKPW
jgi:RHS repeat-associated protein